MASSLIAKAERRASEMHLAAIRDALARGDAKKAFDLAIAYARGEAAKVRRRNAPRQAMTDAEMAGYFAAVAVRLHDYRPQGSSALMRMPGPDALLKAFGDSLDSAEEGARNDH